MRLTEDTLKQLSDPNLTPDERALLRCRLAADLIHTGRYEDARDALGDLWQGIGERPELKGLEPQTAAEVLLQSPRQHQQKAAEQTKPKDGEAARAAQ